jgi:adenosylcobalamin-dependent ribonucleoside-triphosphate reductase
MRDFKLSVAFLDQYQGEQPDWGPIGYVTFKRTYARIAEHGLTEEFWETCARVVEGVYSAQKRHCRELRLPWNNEKSQRSAQEMFRRMWDFKWLPPGRGLWMMGTDYVDRAGGAPLQNCGFVSTKGIKEDFADPFTWMMDMLMLGVGVGFDTKGAGLVKVQAPRQGDDVYVVDDSREGWVDLVRRVLTSYSGKGSLPRSIDYSQVRPAGRPINGFGGTASGPAPLDELVVSARRILDELIDKPITTEAIVDICNLIGRCVVAGNVRRSAEIAFGDPHDDTFLALKDPDLHGEELKHHRWASNNSIFADVGMDYDTVSKLTAKNGEPGYQWLENAQDYGRMGCRPDYRDRRVAGANPCVEQSLEDRELCCLVETFPSRHETYEDYEKTLKYAYLYAKSVTLISTHDFRTNAVMMRNRRIGCSMSGIAQAIQVHGRRAFFCWCDQGYNYLGELDDIYSEWLCIPRSIKKTSVKPSGTVSLLPGVTPGIHYPHSEYYIRRVRFQESHSIVDALSVCGYSIEPDSYSPNTVCVSFPVKSESFDRSKDRVSMWEQLENAAQMQQFWADNQVSITVTFTPEEASSIKYALELYEVRLKGVSFLPLDDHGYTQPPYETISEAQYEEMINKLTPSLLFDLLQTSKSVHDTTERFCTGEACMIPLTNNS